MDSVSAFGVKLGANDLNYVDVPLNPSHSEHFYVDKVFVLSRLDWQELVILTLQLFCILLRSASKKCNCCGHPVHSGGKLGELS